MTKIWLTLWSHLLQKVHSQMTKLWLRLDQVFLVKVLSEWYQRSWNIVWHGQRRWWFYLNTYLSKPAFGAQTKTVVGSSVVISQVLASSDIAGHVSTEEKWYKLGKWHSITIGEGLNGAKFIERTWNFMIPPFDRSELCDPHARYAMNTTCYSKDCSIFTPSLGTPKYHDCWVVDRK